MVSEPPRPTPGWVTIAEVATAGHRHFFDLQSVPAPADAGFSTVAIHYRLRGGQAARVALWVVYVMRFAGDADRRGQTRHQEQASGVSVAVTDDSPFRRRFMTNAAVRKMIAPTTNGRRPTPATHPELDELRHWRVRVGGGGVWNLLARDCEWGTFDFVPTSATTGSATTIDPLEASRLMAAEGERTLGPISPLGPNPMWRGIPRSP